MKKSIHQAITGFAIVFLAIIFFACNPVSEIISLTPAATSQPTRVALPPIDTNTVPAPLPTISPLVSLDLSLNKQDLVSSASILWLAGDQLAIAQSNSISLVGIPSESKTQSSAPREQAGEDVQNPIFLSTSLENTSLAWISNARTVQYWSYSQSQEPVRLAISKSPVTGLAIGPEGKKVAYADSSGDVIQVATNKPKDSLTWKAPAWLSDLSYSPDGQRIGGVNLPDYTAYIFLLDGKMQKTFEYASLTGLPLSGGYFCPNWTRFAWISGSAVQIIDLQSGENGPMLAHMDAVSSVAWSPDCRFLATASALTQSDTPIPVLSLWDLNSNGNSTKFPQPSAIQSISFSPNGQQLAVMDTTGQVRVYQLP
jgi:WD40 repeat protein